MIKLDLDERQVYNDSGPVDTLSTDLFSVAESGTWWDWTYLQSEEGFIAVSDVAKSDETVPLDARLRIMQYNPRPLPEE